MSPSRNRSGRARTAFAAVAAVLLAAAGSRTAAASDAPEPGTASRRAEDPLPDFPHTPMGRVVGDARRDFDADLEGERGRLALLRASLDVEGAVPVTPRLALRLAGGVLRSRYDFSDPDAIVAGDGRLVEDTTEVRLLPGIAWEATPSLQVLASGWFGSGWAPGADPTDGLWVGGGLAVRHAIDGPFGLTSVTLGAGWRTSLEAGGYWVPILSFGGVGRGGKDGGAGGFRVALRGAGVGVVYGLSDRFGIGVSVGYDRHEYRLAGSDRVEDGVFRDLRIPVTLDVDWRPTPRVTLTASLGVNVYTEMEIDDEDGDRVSRFTAGPSLVAGLHASVAL